MDIRWNEPLETVDGIAVRLRWPDGPHPEHKREVYIGSEPISRTYHMDGRHYALEQPDIRNVRSTATSPDLQARCVALVERMAERRNEQTDKGPYIQATDLADEARSIMAEMRPVDPDILAAREIVECTVHWSPQTDRDIQSGKNDSTPEMKIALAAIRKGRALERGEQ